MSRAGIIYCDGLIVNVFFPLGILFRRKANRLEAQIRSTATLCCSFQLVWSLVAAWPRSPARQAGPTVMNIHEREPEFQLQWRKVFYATGDVRQWYFIRRGART